MSLNYNLTHIDNWQELLGIGTSDPEPGFATPITEALIWATLLVGMPQITEKNVSEFAFRLRLYETVEGHLVHYPGYAMPIPFSQVKRHIGLHTNANPLTRAQYIKNVIFPALMEKITREDIQATLLPSSTDPQVFEVRLRCWFDGSTAWESFTSKEYRCQTDEQAQTFCQVLLDSDADITQVRWNWKGSLQGHYLETRKAGQQA